MEVHFSVWQKMYHSFGGHVVRHKNLVEQGQLLRRHETLRRRGLERRRRESRRLYRRGFTRWEGGEEKWRRRQSGGGGGGGGGAVVKTPARTELRKNSSGCGGPILRKKNGRSVRATNWLSSLLWAATSSSSVVADSWVTRPKLSKAVASMVWKASDMSEIGHQV